MKMIKVMKRIGEAQEEKNESKSEGSSPEEKTQIEKRMKKI
jgi:hypothetical protein